MPIRVRPDNPSSARSQQINRRPAVHGISWPALEGLAAYAFLIALSWSLPATTTFGPVVWGAFLIAGLGGGSITLAYLRERTEESQQPRLHGAGTTLVALGTAILVGAALF